MRTTLQYTNADRQEWALVAHKRPKMARPYIPEEILFNNILNRLPVESLLRLSCVSKLWYAMIKDPKLMEIHAKENSRSRIVGLFQVYTNDSKRGGCDYVLVRKDGGPFVFSTKKWTSKVGNSNGLFCIRSKSGFEICNPTRREFFYQPFPPCPPQSGCGISYGFGFDPLRNEYKVVQIVIGKGGFQRCMVYTMGLGAKAWRDITVASKLSECLNSGHLRGEKSFQGTVNPDRGLYLNGGLHWFFRCWFRIMSFDLHYETFCLIPKLYNCPILKTRRCFLTEWQNCVCIALHSVTGCSVHLYKYNTKGHNWIARVVRLRHIPASTIGFLGVDGESFLYWSVEVGRLWLYSPVRDVYSLVCSSGSGRRETFRIPLSLEESDPDVLVDCEYVNQVETLFSLTSYFKDHHQVLHSSSAL